MKRLLGLSVLAVLLAAPAMAWAQGPDGGERRRPRQRQGDRRNNMQAIIGQLDLTEEQRPKVREAMGKVFESQQADRAKLDDLRKRLRDAREAKDEAKLKEAQAEFEKMAAARNARIAEALKPILTAEQYEKLLKLQAEQPQRRPQVGQGGILERAKELELTEEQIARIKALGDAAREEVRKLERDGREGVRRVFEKLRDDVNAILTPEQQEKWKKMRTEADQNRMKQIVGRMTAGLDLTDEQKQQVDALAKAAVESVQAATTVEARRQIIEKLNADIRAVLTPEQQKKLDERRSARRDDGPRRERGERRRDNRPAPPPAD